MQARFHVDPPITEDTSTNVPAAQPQPTGNEQPPPATPLPSIVEDQSAGPAMDMPERSGVPAPLAPPADEAPPAELMQVDPTQDHQAGQPPQQDEDQPTTSTLLRDVLLDLAFMATGGYVSKTPHID